MKGREKRLERSQVDPRSRAVVMATAALAMALSACSGGSGAALTAAPTVADAGAGSGTVRLAWDEPTANADGTPILDLAGYHIYYQCGDVVNRETATSIELPGGAYFDVTGLAPGPYAFAMCAVHFAGNESALLAPLQVRVP